MIWQTANMSMWSHSKSKMRSCFPIWLLYGSTVVISEGKRIFIWRWGHDLLKHYLHYWIYCSFFVFRYLLLFFSALKAFLDYCYFCLFAVLKNCFREVEKIGEEEPVACLHKLQECFLFNDCPKLYSQYLNTSSISNP